MKYPERVERLCLCAAAPKVGQAAFENWMRSLTPHVPRVVCESNPVAMVGTPSDVHVELLTPVDAESQHTQQLTSWK